MDRDEALVLLPHVYATALRLAEEGVSDGVIAHAIAIEPEAVATLLDVARSKLAELTAEEEA